MINNKNKIVVIKIIIITYNKRIKIKIIIRIIKC
jgi:hypothetical protein